MQGFVLSMTNRDSMYSSKFKSTLSCKECALQLLSRRDHSEHELQQKLISKGYDTEIIVQTMSYCLENHYLDELRYAASQIRQHVTKGHGERRIRQELSQKRVSSDDIETALYQEPQDWFELAKAVAEKKIREPAEKGSKEHAKQVRFLQYRGFSFEQISYALSSSEA
ncbi:recombination regulator RecX [Vibrio anguillarum]|uniref:recombination regulator RecX n=1 Tax=Vibrio anguillarum TaxID=55601 RepID=UPI00188D0757|nr:recombination regulator RecX [Vibrio anguillarum]MBF4384971.1 recombination regulator RecX [Vibrio anguillarum]MBF4392091.1 recombination regulator RecX [Vibrio anguillarum]MBF4429574.1 recombination regulator RecX [Vibrio anguillarum]